jgi:para-aminobenzoate synthetase component 1
LSDSNVTFRPRVLELEGRHGLAGSLSRLRGRRGLVALDSAAGEPRRFGLIGFDPVAPVRLGPKGGDWVGLLRDALARFTAVDGDPLPGPFHGGFLGALAYDLGVPGEHPIAVAPEPFGLPLASGGLYTDFMVRDECAGRTWLVLGEEPGDDRASVAARRAEILGALEGPDPARGAAADGLVRHVAPADHRARIERARAHIAAGDVYQVNLAHRFTADTRGDPLDLYLSLRAVNPAPYMGYLAFEEQGASSGALLSASPELLLDFDGETLRTRPIKGTAPRGGTRAEDRALAEQLLASEKDRAELVMIVDLERNDLGRIAVPGGVRVEGLPTLQSFARVHHLMADVVARPAPGRGALDALAALFPGGSVTGAPKLRSMELIAELEGEGRGYFCGTLGFLDARGHGAFNLLIRTMTWRPRPGGPGGSGEVAFRVGGGITWSSDAAAEDRETLAKADGLIDALTALGGDGIETRPATDPASLTTNPVAHDRLGGYGKDSSIARCT